MRRFNIALAQYPILYHASLLAWKQHIEEWVQSAVSQKASLLVFPEYGSLDLVSLFPVPVQQNLQQQIEALDSLVPEFIAHFEELACKYQVYVLAPSLPIKKNNLIINTAFFFSPKSSKFSFQDKINLTRFESELWGIDAGPKVLRIFDTELGKIGINICFDSEFPQLAFELAQAGVEILLVPSCTETDWGLNRIHIGSRARALENQMWVAVSSTVGEAPWSSAVDINTGHALLCGPSDVGFPADGIIKLGEKNVAQWVVAEVDLKKIHRVRRQGQVFNYQKAHENSLKNQAFTVEVITM